MSVSRMACCEEETCVCCRNRQMLVRCQMAVQYAAWTLLLSVLSICATPEWCQCCSLSGCQPADQQRIAWMAVVVASAIVEAASLPCKRGSQDVKHMYNIVGKCACQAWSGSNCVENTDCTFLLQIAQLCPHQGCAGFQIQPAGCISPPWSSTARLHMQCNDRICSHLQSCCGVAFCYVGLCKS